MINFSYHPSSDRKQASKKAHSHARTPLISYTKDCDVQERTKKKLLPIISQLSFAATKIGMKKKKNSHNFACKKRKRGEEEGIKINVMCTVLNIKEESCCLDLCLCSIFLL